MKLRQSIYLSLLLAAAAPLASCQDDFDAPGLQTPVATLTPNTTIAELKAEAWDAENNYAFLVLDKEQGLFSMSPDQDVEAIPQPSDDVSKHYIIKGRVISSDASGNVYMSLYIQDATDAITISVRKNNMYNQYHLGQEVVLDLTGLYVGKYAGLQQIGGYGVYNGTSQVDRMQGETFDLHAQLNGLPEPEVTYINYGDPRPEAGMYCTVFRKIGDLPSTPEGLQSMQSQLVEFRNVYFEDGGKLPYSEYKSSGVSRNLSDGTSTIIVRTSGYANFYSQMLPEGTGTVRGLLGYFNGSWQLTLRSTADVIFTSKGRKDDPYTVEEALSPENAGVTGFVKGYIVGSVRTGVAEVTSPKDIIWNEQALTDNNVVIAPAADTRDISQLIVVPLPNGSALRAAVNISDNPGVIGKQLNVKGTFATLLGIGGLDGVTGTEDTFTLEGTSSPSNPSTPSTGDYTTVFEGLRESDTDHGFTIDNGTLPEGLTYIWSWKEYNGSGYLNASAFAGGNSYAATAYAISPEIDLAGYTKAKASFDQAAKFQTTLTSLCGFAVREAGSSAWTELKVPAWPAAGAWTWSNSGDIDLSAFAGKKIQVAFKYGSSAAGADTWEIKNLKVQAAK